MNVTDKQRRGNIEDLVNQFINKYPNAAGMGADYIGQNNDAQVDAIKLVEGDLFKPIPILISYDDVPEEERSCLDCVRDKYHMQTEECYQCFKNDRLINWYPKEK